jgi:surfeit locus 1 family protein
MRGLIVPLVFGLLGTLLLAGLGAWQLQRAAWKDGVIARIEGRIGADPVPLPAAPDPEADLYLPVTFEGRVAGQPLRVLGAWRGGTGHRVVAPLETEGRRVMVDLGLVGLDIREVPLPEGPLAVTGTLAWPQEVGAAPEGDLWFARDVPAMAAALGTEPLLVVARDVAPPAGPRPLPQSTAGIPDNHLGYAIQWFGLALVWAGMTLYFLWRKRRPTT